MLTRILAVIALCVIPISVMADIPPHRVYFQEHLPTLEERLNRGEFPGPLAGILGKIALSRQVLEDGLHRRPGESCAGISRGGFNEVALKKAIGNSNVRISSASDGECTFYMLHGPQANIVSAITIVYLFDEYVNRFIRQHKVKWTLAKETSRAISQDPDSFELNHKFHCILKPEKIVERCNRIYGPQSQVVINLTK